MFLWNIIIRYYLLQTDNSHSIFTDYKLFGKLLQSKEIQSQFVFCELCKNRYVNIITVALGDYAQRSNDFEQVMEIRGGPPSRIFLWNNYFEKKKSLIKKKKSDLHESINAISGLGKLHRLYLFVYVNCTKKHKLHLTKNPV